MHTRTAAAPPSCFIVGQNPMDLDARSNDLLRQFTSSLKLWMR
jgi:hypothetical protein